MRGDHGNWAVFTDQRDRLDGGEAHDDVVARLLGGTLDLQAFPRPVNHDAQILADSLSHEIAMERRMGRGRANMGQGDI
ncbi:hypothetical protein D3C74_490740 [compost metagenome]